MPRDTASLAFSQPSPRGYRRARAPHRRRARVEDRIRRAKDTGLCNLPFHALADDAVWLELVLIAHDLLAWAAQLVFEGEIRLAEPSACDTACSTPLAGSCAPAGARGPL
jgi:hypothetical protein